MGWPGVKGPITVFASDERTATETSAVYKVGGGPTGTGANYRGLLFMVDVTVDGAAASLTFTFETSSNAALSDAWSAVLTSGAVAAVGSTYYVVHPSAEDQANVSAKDPIESFWRVTATAADSDAITYSVLAWPI